MTARQICRSPCSGGRDWRLIGCDSCEDGRRASEKYHTRYRDADGQGTEAAIGFRYRQYFDELTASCLV
ncbi:hypothetical protein O181_021855 [Austropuccinia psidii MF-1]|uniref:Uncharacterized protein n=1 Tax=Austropuccinia psidii MF-1 TaxID=1389203 RepID=A0A9Q3GXH9_9BASI|nr:hypothetical protein [Austropuccinia psidii MF-1]